MNSFVAFKSNGTRNVIAFRPTSVRHGKNWNDRRGFSTLRSTQLPVIWFMVMLSKQKKRYVITSVIIVTVYSLWQMKRKYEMEMNANEFFSAFAQILVLLSQLTFAIITFHMGDGAAGIGLLQNERKGSLFGF